VPEQSTRRQYLLAAIRAHGRPVSTQLAEQLMTDSPWPTTGRNTVRKDLRGLARHGHLAAVDLDGRRIYHPTNTPEGRPVSFPTTTPMEDHERVLGQIERGEVRVGPDAAREIAARHEEEYGDAFDGTPAEALRKQLFAAALAGLSMDTEGGVAA
jgi:DNA-binding FadR family transcriptional regulator